MKAILVDDEPLALNHLAEELERISDLDIIGKYRSPRQALEHIVQVRPNVVFLDIEMPEMSGIELAERILQQLPATKIVFVTVYDEYAVKAFELNSLDYLLKPLQTERLEKTIHRLLLTSDPTERFPDSQVMLHCLGPLQFEKAGSPPITIRWKTFKAQELFSFLLQYRDKPVRKQVLLEQLWPEIEWKRGVTQLYTAIYQIRKQLQSEQVNIQISNLDEGYMLQLNGASLDMDTWEKRVAEAPAVTALTMDLHLQISSLYKGPYLGETTYLWAEMERRRLRNLWLRHEKQIADYYIGARQDEDAVAHYLKIQRMLPDEENIYVVLMNLYHRLGDRRSVEVQYSQLCRMLSQEMDMLPHPAVQEWFESWKSNRST
ncbi:response regulator [Paenibacillus sp. SZ31]|uniref:response regulator n=1 Tax=Paenibacillus sp. SZ31 TaxID=2725555 RepID=UPI00146B8F1C|nr:response regulator [Paenibacillus sp. SZ31]NMI05804.1 response regulator [Paenibacillus sp. SZ31]